MLTLICSFVPSRLARAYHATRSVAVAALALGLFTHSACAQSAPGPSSGAVLVLAASSLTDVLPRAAAAWTASGHPAVRFSFDATSRLAPQAAAGARGAVFVAADAEWILWLEGEGLVEPGSATVVAGNELVVVVPRGEAGNLRGPSDLVAQPRLAVAGENVPAGRYARQALTGAGVWNVLESRVVRGGSARGVLEWIARGEVGAGVVYRTDALAEPNVEVAFTLPAESYTPVTYWAAPLTTSPDVGVAADFVDFLGSPEGQEIFRSAGFALVTGQASAVGSSSASALPSPISAIRLSLLVAFLATLLGLAPAVALGWLLARHDFPGKTLVSTAVLAPLVIPPVVTGFLLLSLLGSRSPFGRMLDSLGLPVPFTLFGAAIAALIVGLPLYVISIRGAFEAVDPLYEELSWTLGVPPRQTFLRVSLPLALPGIAAGAVLAFARALGEFGATVVLAGNIEGSTRTIALAVYTLLESPTGRETTWVLVGASIALSLLALLGFETLSRHQRRRLDDRHVH